MNIREGGAVENLRERKQIESIRIRDDPVLMADGDLHQWTLKIGGRNYRCKCGCNVFHKPDKGKLMVYRCNSCNYTFETE